MLKYALYNYIPQRYLKRASFEQLDLNRKILDFKDGRRYAAKWAAREIAKSLALMDLSDSVIVCIPASCKRTNCIRFKWFSEELCNRLGAINGFGHVAVFGNRKKAHITHEHVLADGSNENYHIDEDFFKGKNVIVLDDICTTCMTANAFIEHMQSIGANVRLAVFLAKTKYFKH